MVFVETSLFTKLLPGYLEDGEYRELQAYLIRNPDAGPIIRSSGGVRKVRWSAGSRGKSGGVRVIYYWVNAADQIFLLTLYGKNEKADLSATDLRQVVRLLEELKHGQA
jgi:mRNA-degrading endonuclease RelE of RelBE toxin-antitoxin system